MPSAEDHAGAAGSWKLAAAALWPGYAWAQDGPRDLKITRIVGFGLRGKLSQPILIERLHGLRAHAFARH